MKETQRRIKEYQAKLPRMKEKVLAVLILLAMSASMLVTVSFAWVALSTNPAVTGVNTSIASNGNLEIALASGTMNNPNSVPASAVGDSILSLLERNITWGNLINLSDPAYGLDSLVLRPALLNESNLAVKPLRGPIYDASGRVVDMNTNFGYAKKNEYGMFVSSNELGIRAITSMKFGESGASTEYYNAVSVIEGANGMLISQYQGLANNKSYMNALASMMSGYIVENIYYVKGSSTVQSMLSHSTLEKSHVQQFQYMYADMIELMEEQAEQTAALLTWSAKLEAYGTDVTPPSLTKESLLNLAYDVTSKTAYNTLKSRGFKTVADNVSTTTLLKEIDQFLADYHVLVEDLERLQTLYDSISGQSVAWLDSVKVSADSDVRLVDDIISRLVDVGTCTISSSKQSAVQIQNSGGGSILINLISGTCETKITNGILLRFDNRCGGRIANPSGSPLKITAGSRTVTSNVSTTATDNYFENERSYVYNRIEQVMQGADLIAQDVYGFAVDFWVRTNAQGSFLTLQGNVLTRTDTKEVFGKNREGEEVPLYTISVTVEEGASIVDRVVESFDIYQSTQTVQVEGEDGSIEEQIVACWRYANIHTVVESEYVAEYVDGKLPPRKIESVKVPIGYEGDNRVWEGDEHTSLTVNSSTQGSGSCYVFYAENPVDQKRIKNLLRSMKVAFVDDQGQLLAEAYMDVELSYESTGKVIVPLVLNSESINLGNDKNGDPVYAITVLEKNVAKRITAIFYLDGEYITNSEVLASADVRGQMNIQFGSSASLKPLGNEKLYNSELYINAALEGETQFEYGVSENMTTKVKVTIEGDDPSRVEAYFIRKINDAQGSQETLFPLRDLGNGVWEGEYTFRYPGEYILRSVRVDGTERDIQIASGETYPTVIVKGYSITSVRYLGVISGSRIMSDAGSYSVTSELTFATNDPTAMPRKVVGQFLREDGAVASVNYAYDATAGVWRGKATFVSSGEYTMQYVMLDGEYVELSDENRCTLDLTLGVRVRVSTHSPTIFTYDPETMPEALYMNVAIVDNNGDAVQNISGARLYYAAGGSSELYTDLTWNDSTESYTGEFDIEAGIWRFSRVVVYSGDQSSTLRSVNSDAPTFTIIPPTPPTHYSNSADTAQFMRSGTGNVKVTLRDSEAATVYGKFVRKRGNDTTVWYIPASSMSQTGEKRYTYTFDIESGIWELVSVSAYNVMDTNMVLYSLPVDDNGETKAVETEEEYQSGMVFDFAALTTSVLLQKDVSISISYADGTFDSVVAGSTTVGTFGKVGNNVTAAFMDSHSIPQNAMTVRISDPYGLIGSVFTIKAEDVSLFYDFEKAPESKYGGYTSAGSVWTSFSPGRVTLAAGGTAGTFTNATAVGAFQHAGRYVIENANNENKVDYTLTWIGNDGAEKKASASQTPVGAYAVEVWSVSPTVYISDITLDGGSAYAIDKFDTPNGSIQDEVSSSGGCGGVGATNTYTMHSLHVFAANNTQYISHIESDNRTAYLYFKCSHAKTTSTWTDNNFVDHTPHTYVYNNGAGVPAATLTLTGMGNATKAKMTFAESTGGTVNMITQYTQQSSGVWVGNYSTYGTDSFEWSPSANGSAVTCQRFIGYMANSSDSNESHTKTVAKTISSSTLVLTYDGKDFSFTVPTITINNPY